MNFKTPIQNFAARLGTPIRILGVLVGFLLILGLFLVSFLLILGLALTPSLLVGAIAWFILDYMGSPYAVEIALLAGVLTLLFGMVAQAGRSSKS